MTPTWQGPIVDGRTGAWGVPGEVNTSIRLSTVEQFRPPFKVRLEMRPIEMKDPPVFHWKAGHPSKTVAHYDPGIVVHPMYGTSATDAIGNNENVLVRFGSKGQTTAAVSAELRMERPTSPYGPRTGYVLRDRREVGPVWDGREHVLEVEVPDFDEYSVSWDERLVAHVIEQGPATIRPGLVRFGLRLDFCDVELGEMTVVEL